MKIDRFRPLILIVLNFELRWSIYSLIIIISPASQVIFRYIVVVRNLTSTEVEDDLRTKCWYEFVVIYVWLIKRTRRLICKKWWICNLYYTFLQARIQNTQIQRYVNNTIVWEINNCKDELNKSIKHEKNNNIRKPFIDLPCNKYHMLQRLHNPECIYQHQELCYGQAKLSIDDTLYFPQFFCKREIDMCTHVYN